MKVLAAAPVGWQNTPPLRPHLHRSLHPPMLPAVPDLVVPPRRALPPAGHTRGCAGGRPRRSHPARSRAAPRAGECREDCSLAGLLVKGVLKASAVCWQNPALGGAAAANGEAKGALVHAAWLVPATLSAPLPCPAAPAHCRRALLLPHPALRTHGPRHVSGCFDSHVRCGWLWRLHGRQGA